MSLQDQIAGSKLEIADYWAKVYFEQGPAAVSHGEKSGYEAVAQYYIDDEQAEENQSELYLHVARFYANANIEGFKNGSRSLVSRKQFIDNYRKFMNKSLSAADPDDRRPIREEKFETIDKMTKLLKHIKQQPISLKQRMIRSVWAIGFVVLLIILFNR